MASTNALPRPENVMKTVEREPTPEMIAAAIAVADQDPVTLGFGDERAAKVWRAMYDACSVPRPESVTFYKRVHSVCRWIFMHSKGTVRQLAFRGACWAFNRASKEWAKSQ